MDNNLSVEDKEELADIVHGLLQDNKGILGLDESIKLLNLRLKPLCLENNYENRRRLRQIFLTTNPKFTKGISGVLLTEEGFYQRADDGKLFKDMIKDLGLTIGVRVDNATKEEPVANEIHEIDALLDLETLGTRLKTFKIAGCDFAKVHICLHTEKFSLDVVRKNAEMLGLFSSMCQGVGLVPLVVITDMSKGTHDLEYAKYMLNQSLSIVLSKIYHYNIFMGGIIIATTWAQIGLDCPCHFTSKEVAYATLQILLNNIVPAIYGILFISSGNEDETATDVLNEIAKADVPKPWKISFLFSRALQDAAIYAWMGLEHRIPHAQNEFLKRVRANSLALQGKYHPFLMLKNPYTPPADGNNFYDELFE